MLMSMVFSLYFACNVSVLRIIYLSGLLISDNPLNKTFMLNIKIMQYSTHIWAVWLATELRS